MLYVDDAGTIGGYRVSMKVMDSPVHFYAADGTSIGFFHIFAKPEENAAYAPAIDALKARFPHERRLGDMPANETPSTK